MVPASPHRALSHSAHTRTPCVFHPGLDTALHQQPPHLTTGQMSQPVDILLIGLGAIGTVYSYILERVS